MDEKGILKVLEALKIDDVKEYEHNVQFPCLLADWNEGHNSYSDHAGSMGVSISPADTSMVHCFSCGFSGTLLHLVNTYARLAKKNLSKIIKLIEGLEELSPEQLAESVGDYEVDVSRYQENILCEHILQMLFEPGSFGAMEKRGLHVATLQKWDSHIDDRYKRNVFPVRSRNYATTCRSRTNLVGAVGRTVVDHEVKYYNYFKFDKAHYFYGEHLFGEATSAILVEGMIDTSLLWQEIGDLRKEYAVLGSMGAMISRAQRRKLSKWFDEVILFLDNDPSGWTGQKKLAKDLGKKIITKAVRYPQLGGKDPAELIQNGVDMVELIRNADLLVV